MDGIRVLIIPGIANRHKATVDFLTRRGVTVQMVGDPRRAIAVALQERPDIVLISWNLTLANPVKVYEVLGTKGGLLCAGIAEETDAKTAGQLATSGLKHIIHAPISGPVIFMRLRKILDSEVSESTASVGERVQTTTEAEESSSPTQHLHRLLQEVIRPVHLENRQLDTQEVGIFSVTGGDTRGYLISIFGGEEARRLGLPAFTEKMKGVLNIFGRGLKIGPAFTLPLTQDRFWDWVISFNEGAVRGVFERFGIHTFFVARTAQDTTELAGERPGYCRIDLSPAMTEMPAPTDLFLELTKNGKMLKYVHRGRQLAPTQLENLTKSNVSRLYFESTDERIAEKYAAKCFLESSIQTFVAKNTP